MIRYYKGKQKVLRLTKRSELGTSLYQNLEDGELGDKWRLNVFPTRLGWRNKFEESSTKPEGDDIGK